MYNVALCEGRDLISCLFFTLLRWFGICPNFASRSSMSCVLCRTLVIGFREGNYFVCGTVASFITVVLYNEGCNGKEGGITGVMVVFILLSAIIPSKVVCCTPSNDWGFKSGIIVGVVSL